MDLIRLYLTGVIRLMLFRPDAADCFDGRPGATAFALILPLALIPAHVIFAAAIMPPEAGFGVLAVVGTAVQFVVGLTIWPAMVTYIMRQTPQEDLFRYISAYVWLVQAVELVIKFLFVFGGGLAHVAVFILGLWLIAAIVFLNRSFLSVDWMNAVALFLANALVLWGVMLGHAALLGSDGALS